MRLKNVLGNCIFCINLGQNKNRFASKILMVIPEYKRKIVRLPKKDALLHLCVFSLRMTRRRLWGVKTNWRSFRSVEIERRKKAGGGFWSLTNPHHTYTISPSSTSNEDTHTEVPYGSGTEWPLRPAFCNFGGGLLVAFISLPFYPRIAVEWMLLCTLG